MKVLPFRDLAKAYDRIKRERQYAIQLGYEQCRRVEGILFADQDVYPITRKMSYAI